MNALLTVLTENPFTWPYAFTIVGVSICTVFIVWLTLRD